MQVFIEKLKKKSDKQKASAVINRSTCIVATDDCQVKPHWLTAIVKIITGDLSGVNILITADHGFLYTYKPLEESQKISRQTFDGEMYELGRRYALTVADTTANYLLPVKTERIIGGTPMKGYAPQDTVRIKLQGGGENYVHGGISLLPAFN